MRCTSCAADNKPGRKFCAACGKALAVACPACGFANDAADRFCGGCGATLPGPAPAAEAAPDRAGALRPVAVLFADLSGFTALSNRLPADEVHGLLDRFFQRADAAVARFGGTVDKHIGDCVMALFGAPVAHDNDAERAVRAALDIHDGATALARELGHDGLAAHSGIALGTVMAAETGSGVHRPYTVTGASVNLAARLADKAKAGEILVDGTLAAALGDRIATEPAGDMTLDGFDRPVAVRRLVGAAASPARAETPLVGRARERALFGAALDAALDGNGQIVVLRGEAGIGKSRLAAALAEDAAGKGFAIAKGAIVDFGAGRAENAAAAVAADLLAPGAVADADAVTRAVAAGLVGAERRAFLLALLGLELPRDLAGFMDALDPEARRAGRAATLAELAAAVSRRRPLLVQFEDLHWADADMLDAAGALARVAAAERLVLLATARPEAEPVAAWAGAGAPAITLDLAPLAAGEAAALAAGLGAGAEAAPALVQRAEGNPLFLVLLFQHARAGGGGVLPPSLHGTVLARQDRLAAVDRRALQVASVLGQRFRLDALRAVAGDSGYAPRALIEAHLVRRDGEALVFAHALIRDAVYASLTRQARRDLHARAAAWYEGREAALRAEHLALAEDPGAALAFAAAARAEAAAYRADRALAFIDRGLALAAAPADRAVLNELRGDLQHDRGAIAEARQAYAALGADATEDGQRCRAEIGLAQCLRVTDDLKGALAALDRAEAIARARGLALERARIHTVRGNIYFPMGRVADCAAQHQAALAAAREAASPEAEIAALGGLGDANYMLGRMASAEAMFGRCVALAREHGFGRVEVRNLPMAAYGRLMIGDAAAAEALADAAIALAERVGAPRPEMIARHARFLLRIDAGDVAGAKREAERAEAIAVQLGARRFQAENQAFLAECARRAGARDEALAWARAAAAIARETGPAYFGPIALGELSASLESGAERDAALAEAEAMLAAGAVAHNHLFFRRQMIEDELARGNPAAARRHAEALAAFVSAEPFAWATFFVDWGRALASVAEGKRGADIDAALDDLARRAAAMRLGSAAALIARARGA
jgi:class 3 adenylate cyclase